MENRHPPAPQGIDGFFGRHLVDGAVSGKVGAKKAIRMDGPACKSLIQKTQLFQRVPKWLDGIKWTTVMLETGFGEAGGVFCANKTFVGQGTDVFAHCVDTHPCHSANHKQ